MFRKYPKLFEDPGINYPIHDLDLDFAEYITKNKNIIATYREDLHENPKAQLIIDSNTPFEYKPSITNTPGAKKTGALLIHGLLDTPFKMQDIGKELQAAGLLVRSVILPGHGTVPGALLNMQYEDWLQAVRYGIHSLKNEVDQIFLVGFSTGAILSLYHALQDASHIAGIIMLCPAFKIKSRLDFSLAWNRAINWVNQRMRWLHIDEEIDYTKYCSIPYNAPYQVYRLTREIKRMAKPAPCPLFMVLSLNDLIVSSTASMDYFHKQNDSRNQMIMYGQPQEELNDACIIVRHSSYPEWHIVNFSHICIPISKNNFHYGMHGDYPLASHIEEKSHHVYGALDKATKFYGALLYKYKFRDFEYQRLTFNPDFEFMVGKMKEFISANSG